VGTAAIIVSSYLLQQVESKGLPNAGRVWEEAAIKSEA